MDLCALRASCFLSGYRLSFGGLGERRDMQRVLERNFLLFKEVVELVGEGCFLFRKVRVKKLFVVAVSSRSSIRLGSLFLVCRFNVCLQAFTCRMDHQLRNLIFNCDLNLCDCFLHEGCPRLSFLLVLCEEQHVFSATIDFEDSLAQYIFDASAVQWESIATVQLARTYTANKKHV